MLTNAELTAEDLRCGAHVPLFRIADTLAHAHAKTEIDRTSNQCSGKHAGFLAVARHEGHSTHDYLAMDHPVQAELRSLIEGLSGHGFHPHDCNCDGCSAPTYALPIKAFAYAFAKLRTGVDVGAVRAKSAAALFEACTEFPWFMAGEGRFDTVLMRTADGRLFAKTGAEGVYIAALRDEGLGIAIKCDDGNGRAAEVTVARLAGKHMNHDATKALARRDIADFNGNVVGELKAV